jgi:hypothetical protein
MILYKPISVSQLAFFVRLVQGIIINTDPWDGIRQNPRYIIDRKDVGYTLAQIFGIVPGSLQLYRMCVTRKELWQNRRNDDINNLILHPFWALCPLFVLAFQTVFIYNSPAIWHKDNIGQVFMVIQKIIKGDKSRN